MKPTAPAILLFTLALGGLLALVFRTPPPPPDRTLTIAAPVFVRAGETAHITIEAETVHAPAEWIEFFQVECSLDGGETWTLNHYAQPGEPQVHYVFAAPAQSAGVDILVRVRAAFRGGPDGDVGFAGRPIDWPGSWGQWERPPSVHARIHVE
ncbi:hypothetical protein [Actomonas aquatica]|uniref:Proteinase inhibitor I42 chagasin domain-containing protein n=1 Tax=Actomonas aquatica TaxID=2866162 RepID=A0ABZ1C3W8_9BACT|nr:hypothetical protein [Opitutus sp. WL0086]WRQ86254.1 hypothetical protein K1X11_015670 [Opitutus sp. WL0086]